MVIALGISQTTNMIWYGVQAITPCRGSDMSREQSGLATSQHTPGGVSVLRTDPRTHWGGLALRLVVALQLPWCWTPSIVRGQQYTLEGDLHASYYRNGDFHSSRDKRFRVEVDGPKYRIRTVIPGRTNYVEWGCD